MDIENMNFNSIIANAKVNEEDFVDIFIESKASTLLSNEGKRLEKAISGIIQGAGLRLISNKKTYYAYTNNLNEKNLIQIAKNLKKAAYSNRKNMDEIAPLNFNEKHSRVDFQIIRDVTSVPIEEKLKKVEPAVKFSWDFDKRVVQVNVTYVDYKQDVVIVNSLGDFVRDYRENLVFLTQVVVSNEKKVEVGYDVSGGF